MPEPLDDAPPAPPRRVRRPEWVGALLLVAVVCGFVAYAEASSARGPGVSNSVDLGLASAPVAAALGLCAAAVRRHVRSPARRDPLDVATLLTGAAVAVAFAAAAAWELAHCRW